MLSGILRLSESLKSLSLSSSGERELRGSEDGEDSCSSSSDSSSSDDEGEMEAQCHCTSSEESSPRRHLPQKIDLDSIKTKVTTTANVYKDSEGKKVNQYVLVKTLGKGSYSKVKLCINTEDNELYALKICPKKLLLRKRRGKTSALDDVMKEVEMLTKLRHPNVVVLYEVIHDPEQDYLYMVLEYLEGGPVMEGKLENKPLDMETARSYFADIVCGVDYLHQNQIIHGDLKPENMLCALDRRVKLIDLGNARLIGDTDAYVGTPAFMPPELCYGSKTTGGALPSRDVWALGVCLYCFIFGKVPFIDQTLIAVYNKIKSDPVVFPVDIDPDCADLITKMLTKEPEERISLENIKAHPWLQKAKHIDDIEPS